MFYLLVKYKFEMKEPFLWKPVLMLWTDSRIDVTKLMLLNYNDIKILGEIKQI